MSRFVFLLLTGFALPTVADDAGMVPVFNGKDLSGFTQKGGMAKYEFKDGVLIGTSVADTPNSFLCTDRDYANFELVYEFKVEPPLNSGVQIRSLCHDKDTEVVVAASNGEKKTRKVSAGRVHGYQVEIDPSPRAWTGGIYDEARRGWLNNLEKNEAAQKAFKQNEWNRIKVVCDGNSIKTWLNGVAAADLKDDMTARGFIAFQVHGIGKDTQKLGKTIQWRNVLIKELP